MEIVGSRTVVVWFGLLVMGLGFGIVVTSYGLPWWLAPLLSGVVYAGSVEFLLAGLLAASAPLAAIALTTALVNSRHLFYGLTFPVHRIRGRHRRAARAYSVFALTDEAFALLSTTESPREGDTRRMLLTQFGLHASWVAGSVLGAVAGGAFLKDVPGIDFVLTALFVVLAIDAFRADPDRVTLALAGIAAGIALLLAPGAMLLVGMSVFAVALTVRHATAGRTGHRQERVRPRRKDRGDRDRVQGAGAELQNA